MFGPGRWLLALLALCAASAAATPARAELELCNRTSYILYTAFAVQTKKGETTQGWIRIVPGDCKMAINEPLGRDIYYTYARTSPAHNGAIRAWGGNVRLCTAEENFRFSYKIGTVRCDAEATALPFARISNKNRPVWTTTFTESDALDTVSAAETAGIKRLLNDNGAKLVLDNRADKAMAAALGAFRGRLHMAASASTHQLFDALETEALKTSAPAGYSVCNDGDGVLWAAIAFKGPKNWLSRGWWKVPAGSCARMLTMPLALDRVFLHVEKHGNPKRFCLTDQTFEIEGRGDCAKRHFSEASFAVTVTKGLAGYAAHVGNQGLVPPLKPKALQPLMPK